MSAARKPPLRTGIPKARWSGPSPAASPASVPPVPHARATTSTGTSASTSTSARARSSSPRARQPRTARELLPPSGTTYASTASTVRRIAGQRLRFGLASVRRPVDEVEAHPVGRAAGQGRVERAGGQFLAADHADRGQTQEAARGGGGAQVVGVGAAERDDRTAGRRREVGRELAPLVADQVRVDQVVPLEQQPDAVPPETPVRDLLHRRRELGPQGGEVGGVGAGHGTIVTRVGGVARVACAVPGVTSAGHGHGPAATSS